MFVRAWLPKSGVQDFCRRPFRLANVRRLEAATPQIHIGGFNTPYVIGNVPLFLSWRLTKSTAVMSSSTSEVVLHQGELPVEAPGLKKKRAAGKAESSRQSKRPKTEAKEDAVPKVSVKISRGRTNARARPPAPVELECK